MELTSENEYYNLRDDRNILRDKFEKSTSFLEYSKIRKEIKQIDELLAEYEQNNKDYELRYQERISRKP